MGKSSTNGKAEIPKLGQLSTEYALGDLTRSRGYNWIVVLLPFPFPQAPSQPKRGGRCSRDLTMVDSPAINHV